MKFIVALILLTGCASLTATIIPELPQRTLRISDVKPGNFEYSYEICASHFLGICTVHKRVTDFYDLNDTPTRQKLINMGFVLRVKN